MKNKLALISIISFFVSISLCEKNSSSDGTNDTGTKTGTSTGTNTGTSTGTGSSGPDGVDPTLVITSHSDEVYLGSGTIQIQGTASDASGISTVKVKLDAGTYENATGTENWSYDLDTTSLSDGEHSLDIIATDTTGSFAIISFTFNISSTIIAVLNNTPALFTNSADISVDVTGPDIESYKYRLDGGAWSAEIDAATAISETGLSATSHILDVIGKNIYAFWQSESSPTTHSWTIDQSVPGGTFVINNNDASTNSTSVTLDLSSISGADNMRFGNTTIERDAASWEASSSSKGFILDSTPGTRTVYGDFKDEAGNSFQTSDDIELKLSVTITVTNGDLNNNAKNPDAPAVELIAITTMYESPGYESEIVKLTEITAGTWTGELELMDTNPRTVIIFDDVFIKPHPYGGIGHQMDGSGSHSLITTDDYFSPCSGYRRNEPIPNPPIELAELVEENTNGAALSPRLPFFQMNAYLDQYIYSVPVTNNEVNVIYTNVSRGNIINVDYTTFTKADPATFCSCSKTLAYVFYYATSYVLNNTRNDALFTDTNFGDAGGSCGPRMP